MSVPVTRASASLTPATLPRPPQSVVRDAPGSQLDALPESERAGFVTEVRIAMDEPVVGYVRLEIDATSR